MMEQQIDVIETGRLGLPLVKRHCLSHLEANQLMRKWHVYYRQESDMCMISGLQATHAHAINPDCVGTS